MHKCKISTKELKYIKYHIHTIHESGHIDYTPRNLLAPEGPVCNMDYLEQIMHMITEEWRTREQKKKKVCHFRQNQAFQITRINNKRHKSTGYRAEVSSDSSF